MILTVTGCNPGPFTLSGTNTYIVGNGSRRILIDTGEEGNQEYIQKLKNVMISNGIMELNPILITHSHKDHIGGLGDVLNLISEIAENGSSTVEVLSHSCIKNGDILRVDGFQIEAIFTPGHTHDHLCFIATETNINQRRFLFSGDCILGNDVSPVFDDLHLYMNSLKLLEQIAAQKAFDTIFPGHGDPIGTECTLAIQNMIRHREKREAEIISIFQNRKGKLYFSIEEIVECIYDSIGANTPPIRLHGSLRAAAGKSVYKHLLKLRQDSKVKCDENEEKWTLAANH